MSEQVVTCLDCSSEFDRIPTKSAGDEIWNVCPSCRTVEGNWKVEDGQ